VRDGLLAVCEARCPRQAGDRQDLFLLQRLALKERPGERVELPSVLREELPGFLMAPPMILSTSASIFSAVFSL
jgi:hypothetical protein